MSRPALRLLERLLDHAHGQGADQAGPFGGLDEIIRFEQRAARRAPACERLEADDLAAVEVHQRLKERHELAGLDAAADFLFELEPVGDFSLQMLVEPGEAVPTGAL